MALRVVLQNEGGKGWGFCQAQRVTGSSRNIWQLLAANSEISNLETEKTWAAGDLSVWGDGHEHSGG